MTEVTPRLLENQLCIAVYNANKQFNHFYLEALRPFHLTYVQYITLCALWERDGQNVRELGRALNLDSGTLTPLLRRLETSGWVKRQRSKVDERQVNVNLTTKARNSRDAIYDRVNVCTNMLGYDSTAYTGVREQARDLATRLKNATTSMARIAKKG